VELRHLLKTNFELFDFDYDFDDLQMKEEIEQAVIEHYFFSEIGQETPDRFKHIFEHRFKSIIQYYNELHNTTLLKYNPLINYEMTEALERLGNLSSDTTQENNTNTDQTYNDKTNSTSSMNTIGSGNSDETEHGDNKNLDYPQNTISGDYRSDQQQNDVTRNKNESSTSEQTSAGEGTSSGSTLGSTTGTLTSNTTNNQKENYQKTIEGMTGRTYQELIRLERENIIRIKSMIIEELKPCFMLIY